MRAARATVVVPGIFALTDQVIGDRQMATFAAFGGIATLVLASFAGNRRDKATAHLGLAIVGSMLIVIGTMVGSRPWLAAVVTVPVAFATFFAGVLGPNAASGVLAALLAYVLPAASPGTAAAIPSRLAGWWLASAAGTAAVLLLSPKPPGSRLGAAAAGLAARLAGQIEDALRGELKAGARESRTAAKDELLAAFSSAPYRPTGLATADQALNNVVEVLEWCADLVSDALDDCGDVSRAAPPDRELLAASAGMLRDVEALLSGASARPDFDGLERSRAANAAWLRELAAREGSAAVRREALSQSFYARAVAVAVRTAAADALIAARQADPVLVATQRRRWYVGRESGTAAERPLTGLAAAAGVVARHASIRSVWFLNSLRGTLALTAAVAVADAADLQHGFWVVLGTLSVLRSNASSTGATAARALGGTVIGFAVGAALLLAIGTNQVALWIVLPVAVLIASYAPGTAPLAVGQAGFTVFIVILFNLLVPVGWTVGLVRIEDVAIGCAVSLAVGIVFWPRGASAVVGDDLADAFRQGTAYLRQAVDWTLGVRRDPPDAGVAAVTAGTRLDDALRGFLAEQGAKRVTKEDLWSLVMASMRLRLAANSLAGLRPLDSQPQPVQDVIETNTSELARFYEGIADLVGRPGNGPASIGTGPHATGTSAGPSSIAGDGDGAAEVPALPGLVTAAGGPSGATHPQARALWVNKHLRQLSQHMDTVPVAAEHVAEERRAPWWRR